MEELKPCPFCGSEVELEKSPLWHENGRGYTDCYEFKIQCKNCGCRVYQPGNDSVYRSEEEAKKNAIKAWNRRTNNEEEGFIAKVGPFTFGPTNPDWINDVGLNYSFFNAVINHILQKKLDVHGALILNEALDAFGFQRIKDGYKFCWVKTDDISSLIDIKVTDPDAHIYDFYFKMTKTVNDL